MKKHYILALDQGTTSSRTIVFDKEGEVRGTAQMEFRQYFPQPGWVEQDPREIWSSQAATVAQVVTQTDISLEEVAALGIANQRETTIVWDARTGEPVYNAIVWQDRRTADFCSELQRNGLTEMIRERTGLIPDSYFSATKVRWILRSVPGAMERARRGELRFGTVDSWLIWKLTGGRVHATDVTNASRTLLYNIHTLDWDDDLLRLMEVPRSMMPQVVDSSGVIAQTGGHPFNLHSLPLAGIAGDQQAALFGQMCIRPGEVKNTYGTGCFLLMNTGTEAVRSAHNLLTTVAWKIGQQVNYALEGSIFVAGSAIQWLRDGLQIMRSAADSEKMACSVEDNGGVYFVPALTGLGAPYWNPYARGTITGITRGTTTAHIARAALEGIAFQTMDIVNCMRQDAHLEQGDLRVDGGASRNDYLMQFQADVLGTRVIRPSCVETTARGAAYLAGLAVGFWESIDTIRSQWHVEREFLPSAPPEDVERLIAGWKDAVRKTLA